MRQLTDQEIKTTFKSLSSIVRNAKEVYEDRGVVGIVFSYGSNMCSWAIAGRNAEGALLLLNSPSASPKPCPDHECALHMAQNRVRSYLRALDRGMGKAVAIGNTYVF